MRTLARLVPAGLFVLGLAAPHLFAAEIAPAKTKERVEVTGAPYVAPSTVKEWLDHGEAITFLDVRQADEFAAGHIRQAINTHYDQVASLADQLPHDHPIVVYCIHSAQRAPVAAKTLYSLGFTNVSILDGGIVAWQVEGLPIQAGDAAQMPKILPKTERCDKLQDASKRDNQGTASPQSP